MAQIGEADDEDKNLQVYVDQNIGNITLEEALNLFLLPKNLGNIKEKKLK
jgi:DNA topoisomerase-1